MKVYIAAPLFNEMERQRNWEVTNNIESYGFQTYLPQRDGGLVAQMKLDNPHLNADELEASIFTLDIDAMDECDCLLILLDGPVIDDGSCFELGYMYAIGKSCFGYKTDVRNFGDGRLNLMIQKSLKWIASNREELSKHLDILREEKR